MTTPKSAPVFVLLLLAIIGVLLTGCGLMNGKKDAEAVIARHFQMIATNGYEAAMADYGAPFFQNITKAEWTKALAKVNTKLGAYQSYTVSSWRIYENATTTGSGTTVVIQCQVVYAKHSATESFTVFKGLTDSDYKIVGHFINSTALLTE